MHRQESTYTLTQVQARVNVRVRVNAEKAKEFGYTKSVQNAELQYRNVYWISIDTLGLDPYPTVRLIASHCNAPSRRL